MFPLLADLLLSSYYSPSWNEASLVSGFRMRGPLLDQNNHTTCNDVNLCVNLFPLKIILVIIHHKHMMVYKYICQTFNLISAFLHQVDFASYPNQSVQVSRYYRIVVFVAYVSYLKWTMGTGSHLLTLFLFFCKNKVERCDDHCTTAASYMQRLKTIQTAHKERHGNSSPTHLAARDLLQSLI